MRGSGSSGLLMRRHHGDSGDGRGQRGKSAGGQCRARAVAMAPVLAAVKVTTAGKFGLVGGR